MTQSTINKRGLWDNEGIQQETFLTLLTWRIWFHYLISLILVALLQSVPQVFQQDGKHLNQRVRIELHKHCCVTNWVFESVMACPGKHIIKHTELLLNKKDDSRNKIEIYLLQLSKTLKLYSVNEIDSVIIQCDISLYSLLYT